MIIQEGFARLQRLLRVVFNRYARQGIARKHLCQFSQSPSERDCLCHQDTNIDEILACILRKALPQLLQCNFLCSQNRRLTTPRKVVITITSHTHWVQWRMSALRYANTFWIVDVCWAYRSALEVVFAAACQRLWHQIRQNDVLTIGNSEAKTAQHFRCQMNAFDRNGTRAMSDTCSTPTKQ